MVFAEYVYKELDKTPELNKLEESIKMKWVVRNGKRVRKVKTTKQGKYRIQYDSNGKPREVRITAKERMKRKLGQRKAKIKRKAQTAKIERKRERSFITRKNSGLKKYNKKFPDKVTSREIIKPKVTPEKMSEPMKPRFSND